MWTYIKEDKWHKDKYTGYGNPVKDTFDNAVYFSLVGFLRLHSVFCALGHLSPARDVVTEEEEQSEEGESSG